MVYKIDWVYLLLCQCPICETGSKDVYFMGSCLMSFERTLKHCGAIIASSLINNDDLYHLPLFIAWLRFSRILQFSCLKPGGFTWVVTPCKERDDPRYAWENITFFLRSRRKLASLSSSKVTHFNFHYYDWFQKLSFDKGSGEKSGKFQLDCDGWILFTRRSINITNSFSFSLHNLPFYTVFRSRAIANITGLILLYRSLTFRGRNSIIDCNFGNTWRVFSAKLIDKVARTLFHSLLLFLLR